MGENTGVSLIPIYLALSKVLNRLNISVKCLIIKRGSYRETPDPPGSEDTGVRPLAATALGAAVFLWV